MSAIVIYTKGAADKTRRGAVIDTESGFVSTFGWFHVGYANDLAIASGAESAAEVTDGHFDALVRDAKATAARLGKVSVDLDDADAVQIGKG